VGVWLVVAAAVALGLGLSVRVKQALTKRERVAAERAETQARSSEAAPQKVVQPVPTTWVPRIDLTGTLKPWRDAAVGFETSGRLVRIAVSAGDRVVAGQELAVLDASRAAAQVGQAESQVAAAQANLALAQDNERRTQSLALAKSIPDAQVEQARQQVALAKAQLEGAMASAKLAKTGALLMSISAPFSGIVTKAPTGIGSVVNAGVPLVSLEDTSRFRLSASLGEDDVPRVSVGSEVSVVYRDRVVRASVIALVPSLDQATRRAPVEIEVPNPKGELLAWSFVRAQIVGGGQVKGFRLPAAARRPGSQDEVVVVRQGKAAITKAAFAVDTDGSLVVERGLSEADDVLVSPNPDIADGDAVTVAR